VDRNGQRRLPTGAQDSILPHKARANRLSHQEIVAALEEIKIL
jgi:hypothetical protein